MWITFVTNTQADDYPQINGVAAGGSYQTQATAIIPLPSGIVSGERLLVVTAARGSFSISPPSGWTPIVADQTSPISVLIAERTATGTEDLNLNIVLDSEASWASVAMRLSGVTMRSAAYVARETGFPDPPVQSWSTGSRDSLALAIAAVDFEDTSQTWTSDPSNYSAVATSRPTDGFKAWISVRVAQRQLPDISSENPGTYLLNGPHPWAASTLLLAS